MGLFDKLSGNDSPDVDAAVDILEAGLPVGWSFKGLQDQLVGRRPVKHETFRGLGKHREPWAALTDTDEEDAARARLEAVLQEGAVLSPRDEEKFGPFTIQALTVHLPDGTGVAAMATEGIAAYDAMIARLRGELAETPTWCLRR